MKKSYQVFYIIKQDGEELLRHMFVSASNQKEAVNICRNVVRERTGKTAFRATTKEPYEVSTIYGRKILTI